MKTAYYVTIFILILGGIAHSIFAAVIFDDFSMRVMWFISQGLMAIFLGFINIITQRSKHFDKVGYWFTNIANVLCFIFVLFYVQVDTDRQSYILGINVFVMTILAFICNKKNT